MVRYEYLPIYSQALDPAAHFENILACEGLVTGQFLTITCQKPMAVMGTALRACPFLGSV